MRTWFRNLMRQFVVWYIFRFEGGKFTVKRKGGAEQTCKIFSKQAYDNIVQKALDYHGVFFSREQYNKAIKESARAVRNCGEDSDCDGCFLRIGEDDCVINHLDKEEKS